MVGSDTESNLWTSEPDQDVTATMVVDSQTAGDQMTTIETQENIQITSAESAGLEPTDCIRELLAATRTCVYCKGKFIG